MISRKIIGLVLIVLFSVCAQAQTASVVFNGTDNFQVTIDLIKQHGTYSNNIKVNKLKGNQPYNVKINFENDTLFSQTNIYLIDDGLTHIYNVSKETIQLKKIIPGASYPNNTDQLTLDYIINNNLSIDTVTKDTAITDTAYSVPFASYYKLEDYEGRVACPFPIKDAEQAKLRGVLIAESLEESKLEKIKTAIIDMDSACVLVDQTKELIVLFEFEETRLDFAKFMLQYTFDIDNYEKLYPTFNYENSKAELRELLKR